MVRSLSFAMCVALSLGACVSADPHATTIASNPNGDTRCREESVTGSNVTRTVCTPIASEDADHDQQVRDLQKPKAMPVRGN